MFLDGRREEVVRIDEAVTIRLGWTVVGEVRHRAHRAGAGRRMMPVRHEGGPGETRLIADYAQRYFGAGASDESTRRATRMIQAFEDVRKTRRAMAG
jgi:hypothetical protein